MSKREEWVDTVKGIAIYLMILGHSIQYASSPNYNYGRNYIFLVIYSFHMPLFMMMSGYLFAYSMNKYSIKNGILAKIRGILVPCISWGIVTYCIDLLVYRTQKIGILETINYVYNSNWFLWTVFFTAMIVYLLMLVFRKKEYVFLILMILNYLLPDTPQFFHIQSVRKLLLFFIIGNIINDKKIMNRLKKKYYWISLIIISIIYAFIMFFVLRRGEYFTSQLCLLINVESAKYIFLNTLMQVTGCLCVMLILFKLQQKFEFCILRKLGEKSLVLYVFSGLVFFFLIKDYCRISESYPYRFKIVYVLLVSALITGMSYLIAVLIEKNKIIRKLFIGR